MSTVTRHSSIDAQHSASSTQHFPAELVARQLLRRYGVVFRDLLVRESLVQSWRDLLVQYRRMELQGEIRGGRFVSGVTGEQFALPEAVESLRAARKRNEPGAASHDIKLSASDPLNLAGVILPGPRVPAVPSNFVVFRDGIVVRAVQARTIHEYRHEAFETDARRGFSQVRPTEAYWQSVEEAEREKPAGQEDRTKQS